ncbi:alpha/beta fold hydrolase [Herbidospora mongoliensis]|uniref:alpha/beta fold hydrolase n=1 Tax=Herbidospora mongoliensis TaxID=688067 RepID=UPI00082CAF74|nr:alpha/beta hydrolase [Herbidospora mongoliensis]
MTDPVISADGTPIEYLTVGHGPHVIVVPGALAVAGDFAAFAGLLAGRHTVHIVQRRGRGGSGPQGHHYGIARECEDVEAVRAKTGARLIFGHSFGGLVALRAACGNPAYDAVAVYEPGVSVDGSIPSDWIERARREVAEGADLAAFLTFIRGINPERTGRVPRWYLKLVLRFAIPRAEMRWKLALMPQTIGEHAEVARLDRHLADYRDIDAPTLIMRGRGRFAALGRLAETIPRAETATFPALDHFAPEKKPADLADTVLGFFATHIRTGAPIEE